MVTDCARTTSGDARDPFHAEAWPMPDSGARLPIGVHRAVGGTHDAPTPSDVRCAALAACQDSTVRMIANVMGVELEKLRVEVTGEVDVRGTLMMDREARLRTRLDNRACPVRGGSVVRTGVRAGAACTVHVVDARVAARMAEIPRKPAAAHGLDAR
jgi:hypothetical protein